MAELDLEKVLLNLVKPMVEDPDSVSVKSLPSLNENEILLVVYAKSEDIARLIGRQGSMASALPQLMNVPARIENRRISVKFESY